MIEIVGSQPVELNFRQRWASFLTIGFTILALMSGYILRARVVNATDSFEDTKYHSGIQALYPAGWLLDQNDTTENLIFRVQDPAAIPFKTTLQVGLEVVGENAQPNDITDLLNIRRASQLATYRTLDITPITLADNTPALQMNYAYVSNETNPFLQTIPIVVRGVDIVVVREKQAIIMTYRADSEHFDQYHHYFDSFLRSVEF